MAEEESLPELPQPHDIIEETGISDPVRTAAVVANYVANAPSSADVAASAGDNDAMKEIDYVICNEKDVLMGRGKRISEWPGNQRFRAIVAKYRQAYLTSLRSAKINVAKQVIVEVMSNGGRFLRELDPGNTGIVNWSKWLPVDMDRCIEKTCQALREKEKPTKRKATTQQTTSSSVSLNPKKVKHEKPHNDEELLLRLQEFRDEHGHMAVPPGWKGDIELADWVTVQRRLFQDLKEGIVVELSKPPMASATLDYELGVFAEDEKLQDEERILETNETLPGTPITERQQKIVDKLRDLEFVVDYEDWHWEQSFKRFVEGEVKQRRIWLRQQRRDYREGTLTEEHRARLEAAGVNLLVSLENHIVTEITL